MYNEYFGLEESPFSIAPDPRYLFMSEQHREALAHLMYGFNSDGGFVLLTGEVGTGKTTVCRCLLNQVPDKTSLAFIFNPKLSVQELLATICDEFGIHYPKDNSSIKIFVDLINAYLLEAHTRGSKAVLIIDEAQNLSPDVLEQLRLLTNLETNQKKLLQIILIGQPELREKLSRPDLRQLSQRIIARYHLGALSKKEVSAYVSHRLSVAGLKETLFPDAAISRLFRLSGGVPRLINVLCDRSLLGAYTQNKSIVNTSILSAAAREVHGKSKSPAQGRYAKAAAWILSSFIFILIGAVLAANYYKNESRQAAPPLVTKNEAPGPLKDLNRTETMSRQKSRAMAFQELFSLWGVSSGSEADGPACSRAELNGLKCYQAVGSLAVIRNLDRPAVLKLSDESGSEYYAALKTLNQGSALLLVGDEYREVSLDTLRTFWLGKYTIFWRPPPEYTDIIKPGSEGAFVQWLERQLSLIEGGMNEPGPDRTYSEKLVKRVKRFQMARGLTPDGIVGPRTIIQLNTAAGIDVPLLTEELKDSS